MYKSIELSPRKDGLRGYYGSVFDQTKQIVSQLAQLTKFITHKH